MLTGERRTTSVNSIIFYMWSLRALCVHTQPDARARYGRVLGQVAADRRTRSDPPRARVTPVDRRPNGYAARTAAAIVRAVFA